MADLEGLQLNLSSYKTQLQQVEATLLSDPDNEDLLKLRVDLTEVLELTQDLVNQKIISEAVSGGTRDRDREAVSDWLSWSVGDKCLASWKGDENYYEARIEQILGGDTCIVTYTVDESTAITKLSQLKSRTGSEGPQTASDGKQESGGKMTKKDQQAAQREYKKKKQQKKLQRWKQMEEERESEKSKWLTFNTKMSKSNKTKPKKSIFATPEDARGKVGVGTCGISGKPMTSFHLQPKWRK